nr:aminocyclopropane-1-carboxylic acid synthase 10 [Litchi chinensis]
MTMPVLEEAYKCAQRLNLKVKGVVVTNPSKPLGTTLTREELNHLASFINEKGVHIISDEVFSGIVFDSPRFISITEAVMDWKFEDTYDIWSRIHVVYSVSKDLGLPGFRVGMIYSNDETVVSTTTKMSSFGLISSQTQFLLANMLAEKKFTCKYMKKNRRRLKKRKEKLVSGLKLAGIECLNSNAGLFCWVDMRHLLVSNTFEVGEELWKTIIFKVGLNITPGSSCHCTKLGWFRVCFANMSAEALQVSMQRVKAFVESGTSVRVG